MAFSFEPLVHLDAARYDTARVSYELSAAATKDCRAMNRAELEQQLEELHPASFAWTLGCCGRDRGNAEEVLQETYLKILDGKARFDGRSTLKTWLFSVIRRTAAAHRRFGWLRALRFVSHETGNVASHEESAERRLIHSEKAAALLRAIASLAPRQREVIELVFYHDMTIEQSAEVVGVSLGTARVHYQRGKVRLRAALVREEML
jgi:RNA polymerase sigma-70 factor (ECF subfamily)